MGCKTKIRVQKYANKMTGLSKEQIAKLQSNEYWVWETRVKFRPYPEAKKFVQSLGLKNKREWNEYCKSGKKPDDIPASPLNAYREEFEGMGIWLGNINRRKRGWRPYQEAKAFVQSLGFKNQREWQEYCKSGKKPDDIPSNPGKVYKEEFEGYGIWLRNINRRKGGWRPYQEAKAFVQSLGFKNQREWYEYCKSGNKPDDIPVSPYSAYKEEFEGYGIWLGTGRVAAHLKKWRPYQEAKKFVQSLGLKNYKEWKKYCKSGNKPDDIPKNPYSAYKEEFEGMGIWLGNKSRKKGQWRPYQEAKTFVQSLSLRNRKEWFEYCKSGNKPDDIPSNPYKVYKEEFEGYGIWLGTSISKKKTTGDKYVTA